ncbi:ABC transporter permease [Caproicibacter sp. BJN0012]
MMLICSLLSSAFLKSDNLTNIMRQIGIVTILSFAQGMIIITGEIDLSIGCVAGMAGTFACIVYLNTGSLALGVITALVLGAMSGTVNGFFVTVCKVPSFIVTLAMQSICIGIIYFYTDGNNVYDIKEFKIFGKAYVFGFLPIIIFFMLVIFIIMHILMKYTKFGRYCYAIGGNAQAARASGIDVKKTKWTAFIISGTLAAFAGVVMMGRLNAGIPSEGLGYETDAIMATVLGGTSFTGGIGTMTGTMIGSGIIGVLNNIMNLMGVNSYIQKVLKGILIILAVVFDIATKNKKTAAKIMARKDS